MKKLFKKCISLLSLLTLIATIKPIVPTPQPEDTEPGISVLGDDDDENMSDHITNY